MAGQFGLIVEEGPGLLGEHIKRIIWSWHDTSFELVSTQLISSIISDECSSTQRRNKQIN